MIALLTLVWLHAVRPSCPVRYAIAVCFAVDRGKVLGS